jgi:uncharacterized membrane protein YhaH (DUF805 family)
MGFAEAVKSAFRNCLKFSGRATRPEYWYFALFVAICNLAGKIFDRVFGTYLPGTAFSSETLPDGILSTAFLLVIIVPHLAVSIRRLHDTNHSGWWFGGMILSVVVATFLVYVQPVAGIIAMLAAFVLFLVILFFFVKPGTTTEPNRFDPPSDSGSTSVLVPE